MSYLDQVLVYCEAYARVMDELSRSAKLAQQLSKTELDMSSPAIIPLRKLGKHLITFWPTLSKEGKINAMHEVYSMYCTEPVRQITRANTNYALPLYKKMLVDCEYMDVDFYYRTMFPNAPPRSLFAHFDVAYTLLPK